MILIGDIGNTDTKICLINSNYKMETKGSTTYSDSFRNIRIIS